MSKLTVGSIEGLASEGYKITVPSGSKIVQTGAVLQVVQTVKTDTFSTTSGTFVDITGLSATITPSATSSKILIVAQVTTGAEYVGAVPLRLSGGNSGTYVGDTAGSRIRVATNSPNKSTSHLGNASIMYLDSPATTSATTYKMQIYSIVYNVYVNRSHIDTDSGSFPRSASSITVMEIAG